MRTPLATPSSLVALLVVALLAVPASAAKDEPELPSAYTAIDSVTYYVAAGMVNGSALMHDAGAGPQILDFQGCAFVQFRPAFERGRVAIDGLIDGTVPLKFEMSDFDVPGGAVDANVTVDATRDHALGAGQLARAEVASKGIGEMHAGIVLNPMGNPVLGNFTDPVSGSQDLEAALFVTRDGVRDDETSELQGVVAKDDDEMHLLIESPPGVASSSDKLAFGPGAFLPDGSAFPESEHAALYTVLNTRYGGVAKVVLSSTSKAAPGSNEMTASVYGPDGIEVANATTTSSLLGDGRTEFEFPLDQMGAYTILAHGKILMGNYRIDVELVPPPAFHLDFWWETVARGEAARSLNGECLKELGLRAQVVGAAVKRNEPPSFPLELVIVAILVSATVVMLLVKTAFDQWTTSDFRRKFGK